MKMTHHYDSNLVDSCMCSVNVVMSQVIPVLLAFKGSMRLLIVYESFFKSAFTKQLKQLPLNG